MNKNIANYWMKQGNAFMPILDQARNFTAFYSDSIFWKFRSSSDINRELSISGRKMKYAIDNDIYSFVLIVDEQSQVRVGKSLKHDITQKDSRMLMNNMPNWWGYIFLLKWTKF